MFRISIISPDSKSAEEAYRALSQRGYACSLITDGDDVLDRVAGKTADLLVIASDNHSRIAELSHDLKQGIKLPIVLLLRRELLAGVDGHLNDVDDFVTYPVDASELELRIRRLLRRGNTDEGSEVMTCGELRIDLARCEVSVAGRPVVLTFKEYELLKYLVSSQGRVCTREALLDRVWGYEYYGGDRTVDVHIRRLRSKIEDATHTFVETVRNVGYRFRAEG